MLSIAYRIVLFIVGAVLIVLGILGLFLPFLQGFLLIALGLSVMSLVSERVARWIRSLRARVRLAWWRYKQRKARSNG